MKQNKPKRSANRQNVDGKLFRLLVASVKDYAIFMLNPEGCILTWNEGAQHIKGYSEDEIIGKHLSVFYTDEDNEKNQPAHNLAEALERGSYETKGWRVRKDGSVFWASVVFTPLFNDSRQLLGFAKVTRDITEQKKAEDKKDKLNAELGDRVRENTKKIIANELKFRTLIENSYDGITLLDKNLLAVYRSVSAERITGWAVWERADAKLTDLIHPEDAALVKNTIINVLTEPGRPMLATYRTRHKQAHYMWLETLFTNMLAVENINAIVCNFREVTKKKAADDLLQKTIKELSDYKYAIDEAAIVSITDHKGIIKYVNQNFCTISQYRQEELLEQDHDIINSSYHDKGFIRSLWKTIASGHTWRGEFRNKARDGSFYWVDSTIVPFLNDKGKPYQYLSIRFLINDRKLAQANLVRSERRYRQIVETAQEGIWMIDGNMKNIFVNKKMCDILGYPFEEIIGKYNYDFMPPGEKEKALARIKKREFSEIETHETTFITKDGREITCSVTTNGIFEEGGKYLGTLAMLTDITHRKAQEAALKRSEANLTAIIENTDASVYSLDRELRFIAFNKALRYTLKKGYGIDIKPGDKILDLLKNDPPEEIAEWRRVYKRAFEGEIVQFTKEFRFGDSPTFFSFSVHPILENNEVIGVSCAVRDITRQKTDEMALLNSEANLSAIIENTTDLVYSLDCGLKFITFNQVFKNTVKHVYGFDVEQGTSTLELLEAFDHELAARWKNIYKKALTGETIQFVNEYPNGTGKIYLSYSINPIWESGKVIGLSVFSRDITQQKADEAAIIKSEANLRSVFENADLLIILFDNDLKIISFNSNAQSQSVRSFGKKLKIGNSVFEYFPKKLRPFIEQTVEEVKKGGKASYETVYDIKGGQKEWYDITWVGIANQKKEHLGVILTLKNITEKKSADLEREKITSDLVRRNKDLEQFTYIISHNLRAPVANIKGLSALLNYYDYEDKECLDTLTALSSAVTSLDNVILDLNYILQVGSQVNEKIEVVSLALLVEDIIAELRPLMLNNRVVLNTDFNEVSELYLLKSYVYSIFQNLITNSIKYRQTAIDPVINIKTKLKQNSVLICLADNGKGIDLEKFSSHLFGLYKRFDFTVEGKGMGLYMVKMQVEALGGTIHVKSEVNAGTEFTIELPL